MRLGLEGLYILAILLVKIGFPKWSAENYNGQTRPIYSQRNRYSGISADQGLSLLQCCLDCAEGGAHTEERESRGN